MRGDIITQEILSLRHYFLGDADGPCLGQEEAGPDGPCLELGLDPAVADGPQEELGAVVDGPRPMPGARGAGPRPCCC